MESRLLSEAFFLSVTGADPSGSTDFTRNLYSKPGLTTTEAVMSLSWLVINLMLASSVGDNS